MKRFILKYLGDFIAKVDISIITPAINAYSIKTQFTEAKIKNTTKIYGRGTVFYSSNLVIGDYCRIGENFFFHAKGGIDIGDNTILSRNVTIYSANHNYKSSVTIPYDDTYIEKPVVIGNSVWIGMNVSILPGVTIGNGAIIGMGAVISKDVKAGNIVVGCGQRTLTTRDLELFNNLKRDKQYYGKYTKNR
jgi:acetyltransferase-like isoleucine patch superfamily enzyme